MTIRHHQQHHQLYTAKFCGIFFAFSALVLFASIAFYLSSINAIAIQGNTSSRSERNIEDLAKRQRQLQVEMAELSSLYRLKDKEGEFQLIAPDEVLHITEAGPLALR